MGLIIPWPSVRQALIRQLRSNLVLEAGLSGDWSEGFAPQKLDGSPQDGYPLGVIQLHYSPRLADWTGVVDILGIDVVVFAKDQGEADSLYQSAFTTLSDQRLAVTGQTSLSCRQVSSISLKDSDAQGEAIFETGGVWEIRVTQSNPALSTLTITGDSDIG